MITATHPQMQALDFTAVARWPVRAAAHVLGIGLLCAVIAALPVAPTDLDRHQLPKESIVHLATWLAVLLARPLPARGFRPATWIALGILSVAVVASAIFATNTWLAFRAGSLVLTGMAALLTARHIAALGAGTTLLNWCGAAGVIGAGTGLAQAYGLDSPFFASTRLPGGTFGNRNFMAHFSALTLPLLMMIATSARRRLIALAALCGCAVLVTAIVLSRSRAAWLAVGGGVIVFVFFRMIAGRRHALQILPHRLVLLVASLVVGATAAMMIPNRLSWRSDSPYADTITGLAKHDEGSGHGRILQYRNTLSLARAHPLVGVGPGNWPIRYPDVAPPGDPSWVYGDVIPLNPWPSSDWIAVISELGILGTIGVLLTGLSFGWRGLLATRSNGERVVAGATLLAMLAVVAIEGTFDAVLLLPVPMLFFALSAGALLQRSDAIPESLVPAEHSARWTFALALLLGITSARSLMQTFAYTIAGDGRTTSRLTWAARVDPGSYPIRIALAQRETCVDAKNDILAVMRLAPAWPATVNAARRCGIRRR